ncbi:MAG: ProQ/FinO family protein [Burkholderiaceae bacterium]
MNRPDTPQATAPRPRRKKPATPSPGASRRTGAATTTAQRPPLLDWLAQHYPQLFGEHPRPLKRGIYEDLIEAHGDGLEPQALKDALARHTRSTRYLAAVAEGQKRHSLAGEAVESPTPEQVHHALVEVFRRRAARSPEDLRPRLRERIGRAFEASGLEAMDYAARVAGRDETINELTREALADAAVRLARAQALRRAFAASGQSLEGFAAMYGLSPAEARRTLGQATTKPTADAG